MNLKEELFERGFVYQFSDEKVFDLYGKGGETFYIGFDPSADSLHLGNFCGIMLAINLMKYGNKCYFLSGGATGMIGDPGGKDSERNFLDEQTLAKNTQAISAQLKNIVNHLKEVSGQNLEFDFVNNYDFYKDMNFLSFLREVGKYMTVNQMMSKETVKKRIEDPDKSISYTEFSYMLIQGYDYYKLFSEKGAKLQIGGSDQWGNLVTGVELIRKKTEKEAYAITLPLITDSNGKKFGKSEGNAIWLSKQKNSPYFVYQYFMNTTDEDIEKFMKLFTLEKITWIKEQIFKHQENPENRYGQKTLAFYVTKLLFGEQDAQTASKISQLLFGNEDKLSLIKDLSDEELEALFGETGGNKATNFDLDILDTMVNTGLCQSKGEGKKLIQGGGIYLNENKIETPDYKLSEKDFINSKVALLRKGKKTFKLIIKN